VSADARTGCSNRGGTVNTKVGVNPLVHRATLDFVPAAGVKRRCTVQLGFINIQNKLVSAHAAASGGATGAGPIMVAAKVLAEELPGNRD